MKKWEICTPKFEAEQLNDKLRVAPWEGHRWFAYDYIKFVAPKKIVELGTHYGCSFFAFCQSVKDFGLNSKVIAVDTWAGDEQAGYYGEDVYDTVKNTVTEYFHDIDVELNRMVFDDALQQMEDNSIDLLHIDGLHTYEAVKHDFETWLPKLAENGVILFHDVFSPLEYGSNIYWKEVKERYPYLEFKHSWGLGILFPKGNLVFNTLESENIKDKVEFYTYKALYEFEKIKTNDLSAMVDERDNVIKSNEDKIKERDQTINSNENMIEERDKTIRSNESMIEERDKTIKSNEGMIEERDNALRALDKLLQDRDASIKHMDNLVQESEKLSDNYVMEIHELKDEISDLSNVVTDKQNQLDLLQERINYYQGKKIILNFRKREN
ncbi:class I SAM-dependent methyltransferase [Paenibacillus glacialis]|uniref:class I SAM-dependent methyltransferase n=1 Tax=Paenibacillus glacialis TaxID=494026 RepID=UPI0008398390|nr:class I SAM-dependent methyltransferase [Paenibacillus glacialis]